MDTEKCRILLSILKNGSRSAAAEELGYTPSGISRAVEAMETAAGFPILRRGRKGVSLSREGEALLPAVKELAYWGERYEQTARKLCGLDVGSIAVGASYVKYYPWLTKVISGFHERYPGISAEICSGTSCELAEKMAERELDFAVISRREGPFRSLRVREDDLVALLPLNHPLAGEKSVSAEIFAREPYIEIYNGRETDNSHCFASRGIKPNISFSTPDSFVAWSMVKAGLGIALVNRVISEELGEGTVCLPLEPPEKVDICVILPEREVMSPASACFASYAADYIDELKNL